MRGAGVNAVSPRGSGGGAERRTLMPASTRGSCRSDDTPATTWLVPRLLPDGDRVPRTCRHGLHCGDAAEGCFRPDTAGDGADAALQRVRANGKRADRARLDAVLTVARRLKP